ncbi:MAG: beta-galactosidase [Clostridia bacterium]|nr:beta-galactosidase [Clostridia bacterium]
MKKFQPPYYGAAYYPEAWDRSEIDADLDRLQNHGLNTVRVAEFAWSTMEPAEGKYDMSLFREVVDKCKTRGISVVMCTPSATPPSWMAHKYPEIFLTSDGLKARHGGRRTTCPTNRRYRRFCANIVEAMAKEFATDENVIGWQIDNEFAPMILGTGCDCRDCTDGFRDFLRERYGTIEKLNDDWANGTWSLDYTSFEEIDAYSPRTQQPPTHKYLWEVYKSESFADFCHVQADIIRQYTNKPIGTDMMPTQQLGIHTANKRLDISQFNYYGPPQVMQFWLDAYRSEHDRPIWLTETSPSWNGASNPNAPRRRGFCRANTLMSFASGGEMALYWLFRSHRGGHEMAHGSVVDAWGRDMQTSPEIREISATLEKIAPMVQGTKPVTGGMAVVFGQLPFLMDKNCSFETPGRRYEYRADIQDRVYMPICREHFHPDVIAPAHDLSPYKMIISHRQMTLEEDGFHERILDWVKAGGTWVVGPYSDIFTPDLVKYKNAPFGHLEDWANVQRAYYIPAPSEFIRGTSDIPLPEVTFDDGTTAGTVNNLAADALVAGEGVRVLATYTGGSEYLTGYAAITETRVGKGRIILLGTQLTEPGWRTFIQKIAAECGIAPIAQATDTVFLNLLNGAYGTVLSAIETRGDTGTLTMPFDCVDLDTDEHFTAGQTVTLAPYRCIFAKKDV